MAFDVQGAIKAGYSPTEVANYLGGQSNFDVDNARKAGYSDNEIADYLQSSTAGKGLLDRASDALSSAYDSAKEMFSDKSPLEQVSPITPDTGASLDLGAGPLRADYANKTTAAIRALPLDQQAQVAQGEGLPAKIAQNVLPQTVDRMQRVSSGDLIPRTQDDIAQDIPNWRPTPIQLGPDGKPVTVVGDIGRSVVSEIGGLGRSAENLTRSLDTRIIDAAHSIGLVSDKTRDEIEDEHAAAIAQNIKASEASFHAQTTAGQVASGLTHMAPAIAVSLIPGIGQVLGPAAFGAQGAWDAGTNAINQGDSLANAQIKAVGQGALNTVLGNVVGGAGNKVLAQVPIIGRAFEPMAADTAAALGARVVQGAGTMAVFKPAGTAIDYATDLATKEDAGKKYDWIPSAADLAIGALMVVPHATVEYASRNRMPATPTLFADGTTGFAHKNGTLFSSPDAAKSFISANSLDGAAVVPITNRMVDAQSKTDNLLGYAVKPGSPVKPQAGAANAESSVSDTLQSIRPLRPTTDDILKASSVDEAIQAATAVADAAPLKAPAPVDQSAMQAAFSEANAKREAAIQAEIAKAKGESNVSETRSLPADMGKASDQVGADLAKAGVANVPALDTSGHDAASADLLAGRTEDSVQPSLAPTDGVPEARPVEDAPSRSKPAPIMQRQDIVGAIMRVTGGKGLSSDLALTLAGDTANNVTKLRGLFQKAGTLDLDDTAHLLRTEEGFDVKDGTELEDLVRQAASGERILSPQGIEDAKAVEYEKQYRQNIYQQAKDNGIRRVGRPFTAVEQEVTKLLDQRDAVAQSKLDEEASDAYGSTLQEALTHYHEGAFDHELDTLVEKHQNIRDFYKEATTFLRGKIDEVQSRNASEVGQTDAGEAGPRTEPDIEQDGAGLHQEEGFRLTGQTEEQARADRERIATSEAQRLRDEQAAEKKRDSEPFALSGSNRPADVLAAHGQRDLLADPVTRAKEVLDAAGVTGIDRTSTIAAVRRGDLTAEDVAESHPADVGEPDKAVPAVVKNEPMFSRTEKPAPVFFSQLSRAMDSAPEKIFGPAKQVKLWLESNAGKLGIKKDEIAATGITDWLDLQNGKVTKQQVMGYLDGNGVKVTETMLGDHITDLPEGWTVEQDRHGNWQVLNEKNVPVGTPQRSRVGALSVMPKSASPTKFHSYVLPGGESYKELLLTLPEKEQPGAGHYISKIGDYYGVYDGRQAIGQFETMEQAKAFLQSKFGEDLSQKNFRSNHFDQPNILAHIRFDERTDADGKKVLFIQELQSDWAQKGRKEGFKGGAEQSFDELKAKTEKKYGMSLLDLRRSDRSEEKMRDLDAIDQAYKEAQQEKHGTKVPPAPFVTDTKAWTALTLKRMIRYAADNGFDRIAWANGTQQAARYDLSKQIDSLHYDPYNKQLSARKGNQQVLKEQGVEPDKIADYVGKEAAKKLLETELNGAGNHELKSVDLKVGGEGMKAYYDSIVPQVANDVLKKLGGGKVDSSKFNAYDNADLQRGHDEMRAAGRGGEDKIGEQPGFDITPEMRDKVQAGQPLFKRSNEDNPLGLSRPRVEAVANRVMDGWKDGPGLVTVDSVSELPFDAPHDVRGAYWKGKVYLVGENLGNEASVEHTVLHEAAGHFGLRKLFGPDIGVQLDTVVARNKGLSEAAKQWKADNADLIAERKQNGVWDDKDAHYQAVEEAMAEMAASGKQINGVGKVIAYVQQWLRARGFEHLANWMESATDAEALSVLSRARDTLQGKQEEQGALQPAFSRADTAEKERKAYSGPGAKMLDSVKSFAGDVMDSITGSDAVRDAKMALIPMSQGSAEAKATAQKFINSYRVAQLEWHKMDNYLVSKFSKTQREAMWNAADEQNTLMRQGLPTEGKGIDTLTPAQREVMQTLHQYAKELWSRAKDAGMVTGEGMPFWTPRMAVMIGEDGAFERPGGDGKRASSKGEGGNITTSASSLKQRKYLTAEETEAAMKGALGDGAQIVRDIRTMPMAMARLESAIAGRELVNQIKELGQVAGKDMISDSMQPNFVTIDHPAFTTFKPKLITNEEGKTVPAVDQNGDMIFDRQPMFISKEWEGPLKAVMSTKDGAVYRAYMLLKSKAMTAIMASPLTHNMVIAGRAMAYDPAAVLSLKAYFVGNTLAKDNALMRRAVSAGMVPMGANKNSMMDITDIARGIGKEGSWGDPNESWINLSAQKLGNVFKDGVGDSIKDRMDKFGDWYHHDLLWKQVGALQTYIFNDYSNYLISKGHPQAAADPIAAHLANRYGGAVGRENMSELARKALNVMLFSRSFNVGNIGAVKDTAFGLPAGLAAKMYADVGKEAGDKAMAAAKGKARMALAADLGMSMLLTSVASSAIGYLALNQTPDDIKEGYIRRLGAMMDNIKAHPLKAGSYNPYQVLPTWDNEEGKQDRIDLGADETGRHQYMRLPTGKVVEDTVGWLLHAPDTFEKKMSPMAKSGWQAITNDKGYGVPVEDPDGNVLTHIAQGLEHVIKAQVPFDTMKTLYDVTKGAGTPLDKQKLAGFATGFSISQGNPHGPAAAEVFAVEDRMKAAKAYAMDGVKRDLKYGDTDAAFEKLSEVGYSPKEINMIIRSIESPKVGVSKQAIKKFNLHSTEEEQNHFHNIP